MRNTGHWLITFLKAHETSGDARFEVSARRAAAYLSSSQVRPGGATFWHRKGERKDSCNGLIGQAWTIEALAVAAAALNMPDLAALAEEVFLLHPFDDSTGLWRRVEIDGTEIGFDQTFNHQLWFAAAGSVMPAGTGKLVQQRVERFIDLLPENLSQYATGLIRHPLDRKLPQGQRTGIRGLVRNLLRGRDIQRPDGEAMRHKAIGYHAFNLYAISILASRYPEHPVWKSDKLRAALRYIETDEYVQGLEDNEFGYPYNPPGFEVAYTLTVFADKFEGNVQPDMGGWVSRQLERCYDFESHQMSLGTEDPITHAARLYEATRLPDLTITIGSKLK